MIRLMGIRHCQRRFAFAVAAAGLAATANVPASAVSPTSAGVRATLIRFTLVTGEQILQRTDTTGQESIEVVRPGGSPLLTYRLGAASYVVPAAVIPYVDGRLDLALFDGARLSDTESNGQVPVLVRWHGTTRPSMPWLVNPHDVTAGATSGRVTTSSGAALERELAAQPRVSRGWIGSLYGIDGIVLDGPAPSPSPTPQLTRYAVTVNGIDASGAPDSGDFAVVLNVDKPPEPLSSLSM